MAVIPLCAKLANGQEAGCVPLKKRYFQQAVIINKTSIDPDSITITKTDYEQETPTCAYNVQFELKAGETGYRFTGPLNGDNYLGRFDKSTSDFGFVEYSHQVQMLVVGADEDAKCILESLDKGNFVVALQFTDGTVEIYGFNNGLGTGDYTYSLQENGGAVQVILQSNENSLEGDLPYVYKSVTPGQETEDFDSLFANVSS